METAVYYVKKRAAVHIAAGMALVVIIGLLEHITGPEIGLAVFYLIPVLLAAWTTGYVGGAFLSAAAGLAWLVVELQSGHAHAGLWMVYWNMSIRVAFYLITVFLFVELRKALQHERALARIDPLTETYNIRFFREQTQHEIERCQRYGHPFTLVFMDIDDFKSINDRYGHSVGDDLLWTVSQVLRRNVRSEDVVARLGGDEFALLLPETDSKAAWALLCRLRDTLDESMRKRGWPVTFSMGSTTHMTMLSSVDEVIQAADRLMYRAKAEGKNRICRDGPAADGDAGQLSFSSGATEQFSSRAAK